MKVNYSNLVELFEQSCAQYADRPLFGTRTETGWTWTSYSEVAALVDRCRAGLANLGVGRGDKVALVSDNRVEWAVVCLATYGLEATLIPMYQSQLAADQTFILEDSGAKVVVCATPALAEEMSRTRSAYHALEHVVGMGLPDEDPRSFTSLLRDHPPIAARRPDAGTIAGIIYTSGTTGRPKGVMLTHGNIASNISASSQLFPFVPEDRSLSFLPWTHAYGQVAELLFAISQGSSMAINDSVSRLLDNLAEVKPTVLVAVPRIFNRLYSGVHTMMQEKSRLVRGLFDHGIDAAIHKAHGESLGPIQRLELSLDDRLIFRKIRERFGGRLRMVISGSASLSRDVAEFIDALGLEVYEGYGLTETGPVATANSPGKRKFGSVGRALADVRIVIDESASTVPGEGEVIVYGPNVMRGYHNRPDENAKVFTADGGLRTGDLGRLDDDGYLFITGRIKEQYKLTNGKYVMPAVLEERIKLSPFVANVFVHGANRPFNIALVVPDVKALERYAIETGNALGDATRDIWVRTLIEREIAEKGAGLAKYQLPRAVLITTEDFTTENAMLTPTLKLKRAMVEQRYAAAFDALYAATAGGVETSAALAGS